MERPEAVTKDPAGTTEAAGPVTEAEARRPKARSPEETDPAFEAIEARQVAVVISTDAA